MGRRLADEQEMPAHRPNRLADRLAGVEVVAESDRMGPCVAWAVGGGPASRRHALAIMLVVPVLRHNELWLQRNDPAMARRHQRRGHQRMEIFGRAAAALARRAARTMQLRRAVIFRAVERDQHMMPQPTKSRETVASFQHFERMGKMRIKAFRLHRVQHIPNMVVARNPRHPKQRLAVRATMAVPVRQVPLMGEKRRALHEERCKRRHADIGMAAFAPFFMQSPSFLAHQRHLADGHGHGRSNCQTLFGMTRIPSDNHVRDMLDPVEPECFYAHFPHALEVLEAGHGLTAFRRLGHHVLIAFDGTEYYRSAKLHCPCCSTRKRSGGTTEYFHTLVAATLVAPGHSRVVAVEPEFVGPQDGHDKQSCGRLAARRWLAAHGPTYATPDPVYLAKELYSRKSLCQSVRAAGGPFLFVCMPSSLPAINAYLPAR